jgi:hypothetical protein
MTAKVKVKHYNNDALQQCSNAAMPQCSSSSSSKALHQRTKAEHYR